MGIKFRDVIDNPPANLEEWDTTIKQDHGLHRRRFIVLKQMWKSHHQKAKDIVDAVQDMVNWPELYIKPYVDMGLSRFDAVQKKNLDLVSLRNKRRRLITITKCLRVELEIRELLKISGKHPVEPDEGLDPQPDIEPATATITIIDKTIVRNTIP